MSPKVIHTVRKQRVRKRCFSVVISKSQVATTEMSDEIQHSSLKKLLVLFVPNFVQIKVEELEFQFYPLIFQTRANFVVSRTTL